MILCQQNLLRMSKWIEEKLAKNEQMLMEIFWPQWVVFPCSRAIDMYMTKIFKHFFPETALPIKGKLYVEQN